MSVSPLTRSAARTSSVRRRGLTFLLTFLLLNSGLPMTMLGQSPASESPTFGGAAKGQPANAEFVPGRVLVRFRSDAAAKGLESSAAPTRLRTDGGEIQARIESFEGSELVEGLRVAQIDPAETLEAVKALNRRADVLYAEPDYIWRKTATPNDPRFGEMYGLTRISAPQAWDSTTGNGSIVVGIIDGGVDINHVDLRDNIWVNPGEVPGNGSDDDGNGYADDVSGWDFTSCGSANVTPIGVPCGNSSIFDNEDGDDHATHVAGTVGARGNNGIGVTGVNWDVRLMSLKVLGPDGGSTTNIIRGYFYARMMRERGVNLRVLNNSYGGGGFSQSAFDAISALNQAGILFVAAAGNDSTDNFSVPHFPSNYNLPNLIAVASTNSSDNLSGSSNFGARVVSLGAPGSGILSTTPNNSYSFFSGTSMASPHVAGAAALILSRQPDISIAQLRGSLIYSGDALASLNGRVYTQRRLNANNALLSAAENDTTAPAAVSNLRTTSQNGRTITLALNAPGDDGNSGRAALYEVAFISGTTGATFILNTFIPSTGGAAESFAVEAPLRQTSGVIRVRTFDNVGNESPSASINVTINAAAADPYESSLSASAGLASTGTPLGFRADDDYRDYTLPFVFPFYGQQFSSLVISTNGTLYFQPQSTLPAPPPSGCCGDAGNSVEALDGFRMIAGLWDDVRTDTTGGDVFVNTSDPDRVIFRWEGQLFTNNTPVQFEIELRRDGTIQTRYGSGNSRVNPVVGIGGGQAGSSYVINSHTSPNTEINLGNAQTVTFAPRPAAPTPASVQFGAGVQFVNEGAGRALINIRRSDNLSGTSTVNYATTDNPAAVRCDDTTTAPGAAFARCDYATSLDTVTFLPGEDLKEITIPIIDDGHVEPQENIFVTLSSPSNGTNLGPVPSIQIVLQDNDAAGQPNPVYASREFFVRQQYLDFLSREPDAGGQAAWLGVLNGCSNVDTGPEVASQCDRIFVSGIGFFDSQEFRLKGFYVFLFYRVALDRLAEYTEIAPDLRAVTGTTPADTFAKRAQFADAFAGRAEFTARFGAMTHQQYVDALLLERYNLQQITTEDPQNPEGTAEVVLTRTELVQRLNGGAGALTRAQVLRAVVQSREVEAAERNRAFVAMQYYGYLRRTPETNGYNANVAFLDANPSAFREIINGFLNSREYQLRFGPVER